MSIAPTLQRYLTAENVQYDVIPHDPTMSSARTAETCRISRDRLAKANVLRRNVLQASHHLRLSDLRDRLGLSKICWGLCPREDPNDYGATVA